MCWKTCLRSHHIGANLKECIKDWWTYNHYWRQVYSINGVIMRQQWRNTIKSYTPTHMISADADVLLESSTWRDKWEDLSRGRGEQHLEQAEAGLASATSEESFEGDIARDMNDTKQRHSRQLSLEARINIECDRIATETVKAVREGGTGLDLPPVIRLPYKGSRALLNIDGKWMTVHQRRYITKSKCWGDTLREYCCNWFSWSHCQFESVLWSIIRSVRMNITATQRMQVSKIMHSWLPVHHMVMCCVLYLS